MVELDGNDDVYNWPFMYAVEVGYWNLTDDQAAQMRELSAARRILHVRRFPRHSGVGKLHRQHEKSVSGPPDCRS